MRLVWAIAVKEFRQIGRDRRTLLILLFVPAFFLLLYGYALSFDIRNIRLAVNDQDRSTESRAVISAFVNSGYFDLAATTAADEELVRLIDGGEARAYLKQRGIVDAPCAVGGGGRDRADVHGDAIRRNRFRLPRLLRDIGRAQGDCRAMVRKRRRRHHAAVND